MLKRFGEWFSEYNTQISWWLIGWMCMAALESFSREQYVMMFIDLGIAYFNYAMWRSNNV